MEAIVNDIFNNGTKVLRVTLFTDAQEGPRDISSTEYRYYMPDELVPGKHYGGRYYFHVEKVEENCITVNAFGNTLDVELGGASRGAKYEEHPPYMVRYITYLNFEYVNIDPLERLDVYTNKALAKREQEIAAAVIERHIKAGRVELYPMKALLLSCGNWPNAIITDEELYLKIATEGFHKHCLRGRPLIAKEWIGKAWAENNLNKIFRSNITLKMYYKNNGWV